MVAGVLSSIAGCLRLLFTAHLCCLSPGCSPPGQALRGPGRWLLRVAAAEWEKATLFHLLPPDQGRHGRESLTVSEHLYPALGPCSLQLPAKQPTSLLLCPSLGVCFPAGLCSALGSALCHPSAAGGPHRSGLQAVKGDTASPPSRSLLPTCRIFAWVGNVAHRGLAGSFTTSFLWLNQWLGCSEGEESTGLPAGR